MLLLFSVAILLASAMAVLLLSRSNRNFSWLGAGSVMIAAVSGCIPAIQVLLSGSTFWIKSLYDQCDLPGGLQSNQALFGSSSSEP